MSAVRPAAFSGRSPVPRCQYYSSARFVFVKTSHMRRVHIPLRFSTSLQRWESKGCVGSAWERQSSRNVSINSVSPRIIFSGIQPTGIPHVRALLFSVIYGHVDPPVSSAITLGRLQIGSSYSQLPYRETSSFSPSSAGMPSPYLKTLNSSQKRGQP